MCGGILACCRPLQANRGGGRGRVNGRLLLHYYVDNGQYIMKEHLLLYFSITTLKRYNKLGRECLICRTIQLITQLCAYTKTKNCITLRFINFQPFKVILKVQEINNV